MTEKAHHYTLRKLEEIFDLSQSLSQHFPEPDEVMTGIYELLLNALEHGNLDIGSETKRRLVLEGAWEAEVTRRFSLPQYAGREVNIRFSREDAEHRLVIEDQGQGFDWRKYLHQEIHARNPSGRGLLLAFNAGFDRVEFNKTGNVVTCIKRV